MITIKFVYDNYPHADLLPITVTAETSLADIENMDVGDTLFLFLCRELCAPDDVLAKEDGLRRLEIAIRDLEMVHNAMEAMATGDDDEDNASGVAAHQPSGIAGSSNAASS